MKTILIAVAMFFAALTAPALACEGAFKFDVAKEIVAERTQSGDFLEFMVIETVEAVDQYIKEINVEMGSQLPLGMADALIAVIFADDNGNQYLALFAYAAGCQIGQVTFPLS